MQALCKSVYTYLLSNQDEHSKTQNITVTQQIVVRFLNEKEKTVVSSVSKQWWSVVNNSSFSIVIYKIFKRLTIGPIQRSPYYGANLTYVRFINKANRESTVLFEQSIFTCLSISNVSNPDAVIETHSHDLKNNSLVIVTGVSLKQKPNDSRNNSMLVTAIALANKNIARRSEKVFERS